MDGNGIGTLNEKPLHAALKAWCARPGDCFEVAVDGFVIDVVRGDLLIEVQTQSFSAIKRKLFQLVPRRRVRLVYPIAREKWIVKLGPDGGGATSRRKSPKRGLLVDLFGELVRFPELLGDPHFSLQVLLIQEEELRRFDGARRRRRGGWVTVERRLLGVMESRLFESPADVGGLVPAGLVEPFTTADLARAIGRPRRLAQRMAFCLRRMGALVAVGKDGRAVLYGRGS